MRKCNMDFMYTMGCSTLKGRSDLGLTWVSGVARLCPPP